MKGLYEDGDSIYVAEGPIHARYLRSVEQAACGVDPTRARDFRAVREKARVSVEGGLPVEANTIAARNRPGFLCLVADAEIGEERS